MDTQTPFSMLAVTLALMFISTAWGDDYSVRQELQRDLLMDYNKHVLPSKKTTVRFRITIKHFDMIEETQSLMVDAWIVNEWVDPRLRWEPLAYGGVKKISLPHDMLWKPDLDVYNSANVGEPVSYGNTLLLVYHDGRVLFVPAVRLHFTCVMDLTYWPHDTHNCTLIIGSWIHDGDTIDPQVMDDKPEVDIKHVQLDDGANITRGTWNILDANTTRSVRYYQCCPEPYITIKMTMLLVRNAPAFDWTVKLPAVGLSVLTLVLFLLPPGAGEKITFGGLCLVLDVLFIAYTTHTVSYAPSHTPLIVELVCKQLVLVVGSVVVAAFTIRLAKDPHTSGLHNVIKQPLIVLATCLCLPNYKNIVSRAHQPYVRTIKSDELELGENGTAHLYGAAPVVSTNPGHDWLLLAAVMDRICLIVYLVIFTINLFSFKAVVL